MRFRFRPGSPVGFFLAMPFAGLSAGPAALAQGFESPPVLEASQAAPRSILSGETFRVEPRVPTDGLTTQFTVRSEAGTFQVLGVETLALREHEIPAIVQLDHDSKSQVFLSAVGSTALKPIQNAAQMLADPQRTLEGLPGGLDRFVSRVRLGAQKLGDVASGGGDASEQGSELADASGKMAADALGYDQELRQLAQQLGVDPYTSNPVLAKKLHEFAQVAFAGHVATNTIISVAVPASMAITGTNAVRNLVYDTPAGDLIARNQDTLEALGVSSERIQALQQAPGFTLTLQTELVEALRPLAAGATGAGEVVALAGTANSADHALFLVRGLRILNHYQDEVAPLATLVAGGTLSATDANGTLVVPGAVDYVSWTERVAGFAGREDLSAAQRTVWITGRMTPMAKQGFEGLGWTVRERVSDRR